MSISSNFAIFFVVGGGWRVVLSQRQQANGVPFAGTDLAGETQSDFDDRDQRL
jgi:hypothetical protein